jgi:hypothetical protein
MAESRKKWVLTVAEVAAALQINPRRIQEKAWRDRYGLASIRLGKHLRFARYDVEEFLSRWRSAPVAAANSPPPVLGPKPASEVAGAENATP